MNFLTSVQKSKKLYNGVFIAAAILIIVTAGAFTVISANAQSSGEIVQNVETVKTDDAASAAGSDEESRWYDSAIIKILAVLIVLGALFVAYICLPVLPAFQSKLRAESVIEHIGKSKSSKGKKVLLGYVTRHGASSSIAQKIYDVLNEKGHNVDMRFIPNIRDDEVSKYDFFIIGSSVYWVMAKEFVDFVTKHRAILSKKPVAVFATCLTIQRDTPKNRERVEGYFNSGLKNVPEIKPIEKIPFAGKVDMEKLNSPERAFLRLLFSITPLKGGDHRDYKKISDWAAGISKKI